jgi:hypothetical protein
MIIYNDSSSSLGKILNDQMIVKTALGSFVNIPFLGKKLRQKRPGKVKNR